MFPHSTTVTYEPTQSKSGAVGKSGAVTYEPTQSKSGAEGKY